MDVNRANLDNLFKTFSTAWQQGIEDNNVMLEQAKAFCTEFPSTTASNFYAWLSKVPGFRKWVGDRVYNNVASKRHEVVNVKYEDSISLTQDDLEDDQYGVYTPIIKMMGIAWLQLQRDLILQCFTSRVVSTAPEDLCFTGYPLASDSHLYGANTIDNKSTTALSKTEFEAACLAASAWKYEDGSLVKPNFTHLLVGEKLRSTAFGIVVAEEISDGAGGNINNPNKGKCQLVILPELAGTYDDYWFLVDASKPVKPVALQIRKTPQPLMDTDPATLERTGKVDFLASGRLAASPTFPHLVYCGIVA